MTRNTYVCALTVVLVGCGGASEATEGDHHDGTHHAGGEEGGDHHAGLPPAVDHFHAVLGPIWHSDPGSTRRGLACSPGSLHDLESAADDVQAMGAPEGVDENEWNAAADGLAASVDGVAGACEAGGDEAETRLGDVHEAFHVIAGLAGHDRDAPTGAAEPDGSVE